MKNYFIQDNETGKVIYSSDRFQEAEVVLEAFEKADKMNEVFVPNRYEIRDMEQIIDDNNDLAIKDAYKE